MRKGVREFWDQHIEMIAAVLQNLEETAVQKRTDESAVNAVLDQLGRLAAHGIAVRAASNHPGDAELEIKLESSGAPAAVLRVIDHGHDSSGRHRWSASACEPGRGKRIGPWTDPLGKRGRWPSTAGDPPPNTPPQAAGPAYERVARRARWLSIEHRAVADVMDQPPAPIHARSCGRALTAALREIEAWGAAVESGSTDGICKLARALGRVEGGIAALRLTYQREGELLEVALIVQARAARLITGIEPNTVRSREEWRTAGVSLVPPRGEARRARLDAEGDGRFVLALLQEKHMRAGNRDYIRRTLEKVAEHPQAGRLEAARGALAAQDRPGEWTVLAKSDEPPSS